MSSDSAGVPWQGRHFDADASSFAGDDGSAPPALVAALDRFAADRDPIGVVDALRTSRLLIPLVARVGDSEIGEHGLTVDKSAELAIVTVAGPDGRDVLPVFSSVDTMSAWNPDARPVPSDAVRVALAAASESTELVVLDPGSRTEFAVRRPAVWAVAQQKPWIPPDRDPAVQKVFADSVAAEPDILTLELTAGDPAARLLAPELTVTLTLRPGLDQPTLAALITRVQAAWSTSPTIAAAVDSLSLKLRPAD